MKNSQTVPPVLAIAGPTASGKSNMALDLADIISGEIVNADALQVYSGLSVLTARPSALDISRAPHHLYGHVDPEVRYSVGAWIRDAIEAITAIRERGRTAILVGGTGLYFKALFEGLASVPAPKPAAVTDAQKLLEQGIESLRAEADRLDPLATSRVLGDDPQRLLRIVSVARGTDKALSDWQNETRPLIAHWSGVVVEMDRAKLYARIDRRFDAMIDMGGLEEAKALLARGLDPELPALKAIGVSELLLHLRGELSLEEAIELAKRNSRRLAKRQMTWFRNQCADWPRVPPDMDAKNLLEIIA